MLYKASANPSACRNYGSFNRISPYSHRRSASLESSCQRGLSNPVVNLSFELRLRNKLDQFLLLRKLFYGSAFPASEKPSLFFKNIGALSGNPGVPASQLAKLHWLFVNMVGKFVEVLINVIRTSSGFLCEGESEASKCGIRVIWPLRAFVGRSLVNCRKSNLTLNLNKANKIKSGFGIAKFRLQSSLSSIWYIGSMSSSQSAYSQLCCCTEDLTDTQFFASISVARIRRALIATASEQVESLLVQQYWFKNNRVKFSGTVLSRWVIAPMWCRTGYRANRHRQHTKTFLCCFHQRVQSDVQKKVFAVRVQVFSVMPAFLTSQRLLVYHHDVHDHKCCGPRHRESILVRARRAAFLYPFCDDIKASAISISSQVPNFLACWVFFCFVQFLGR